MAQPCRDPHLPHAILLRKVSWSHRAGLLCGRLLHVSWRRSFQRWRRLCLPIAALAALFFVSLSLKEWWYRQPNIQCYEKRQADDGEDCAFAAHCLISIVIVMVINILLIVLWVTSTENQLRDRAHIRHRSTRTPDAVTLSTAWRHEGWALIGFCVRIAAYAHMSRAVWSARPPSRHKSSGHPGVMLGFTDVD